MNENKKKHTLRNVLITLLVLCVLGGGGYFGYVKYQEYQEEQAKIAKKQEKEAAEKQEKIDAMLKGLTEEDIAKLDEKRIASLAGCTTITQQIELNKLGIMISITDEYEGKLNSYDITTSVSPEMPLELIETNTTRDCTGMQIKVGDQVGFIVFDRMYGINSKSEYGREIFGQDVQLNGLDDINPWKLGIESDTETTYKNYNYYLEDDTYYGDNDYRDTIILNEEANNSGEPRFYLVIGDDLGHESIVLY